MSIENKISKASKTTWVTSKMPKWQASLLVKLTKLKVKMYKRNMK